MAATEYQLPVPSSRYHSVGCTETVGGVEGQVGEIKLVVELVSCHSQAGVLRVSLKETVQDEERSLLSFSLVQEAIDSCSPLCCSLVIPARNFHVL